MATTPGITVPVTAELTTAAAGGQVRQRAEVLHRSDALGRQLGWTVGAAVRTSET